MKETPGAGARVTDSGTVDDTLPYKSMNVESIDN